MTTFTSPLVIITGRSNRAMRLFPRFHCIITTSQPSHNLLTLVPEIKILYNYLHQLIDFFQKRNSSTKSGGEDKTSSRDSWQHQIEKYSIHQQRLLSPPF